MNKSKKNRFGLTRPAPADVEREIRVRSGFGCVCCGSAFYTYEHVDPLFVDAKVHDPDFMTLLCYTCQGRSGRSLSKETIKKCMQNPKCLQEGYSFGAMDIGSEPLEVVIGNLVTKNVKTIISIYGEDVFAVAPPEVEGGPYRLSAMFRDVKGKEVLKIANNEWLTKSDNWDVRFKGQRLTIWHKARHYALILRTEPPHRIIVERIHMRNKDAGIVAEEGKDFCVYGPKTTFYKTGYTRMEGLEKGFVIDDRGIQVAIGNGSSNGKLEMGPSEFGGNH